MIGSKIIFEDLFIIPLVSVMVREDTSELEDSNINTIRHGNSKPLDTDYKVLENYPNTKNILLKYIRSSLKQLGYVCEFDISTSWCTESNKNSISSLHKHKNSFFSAVYYYGDYDENAGKFYVVNPLNNLTSFLSGVTDYNKFTKEKTIIPPKKNHMIIFPSYLEHGISQHRSDLPRYSLAMNIVPTGNYGQYDSKYDTSWY